MPSNARWGIYRTEGGVTQLSAVHRQRKLAIAEIRKHVNTQSVQWTMREVVPEDEPV